MKFQKYKQNEKKNYTKFDKIPLKLTCSRTSSEISSEEDLSSAFPNVVFSNKNCFETF